MGLEQQISSLVQASENLTGAVNNKIGEIDKEVDSAKKEVSSFLAGHRDERHKNAITNNVLKNICFAQDTDSSLPFWITSGVTVDVVQNHEYFFGWHNNSLKILKSIYGTPTIETKVFGNANILTPSYLKIKNTGSSVGFIKQRISPIVRRDTAADIFSSVLMHVLSGCVGMAKGWLGHSYMHSKWLCADGARPTVKKTGYIEDPLLAYDVLSTDKFLLVDNMVSSHDGYFAIYLQPNTEVIIQAPATYLPIAADREQPHPLEFFTNCSAIYSTWVNKDGTITLV
ncbi:hypothetical protein WAX87_07750 [Photobacterium damselae subsp. damselae]|uniref:hypothetical protein n=1 Tax=Photobacterium damselae TaxID=38293 RepID=UPI00311B136A